MIIVFAPTAEADLREIADAIAIDNPSRARSFVYELHEKALHLAELPQGFPIVPELAHLRIRRRNHGMYAIFYIADPMRIRILRFLHAARDIESALIGI